jgi:hypothetical protein
LARRSRQRSFEFLGGGVERDIVSGFEVREDFLAMGATNNVFLPGIHFRGEQGSLVIGGKRFGVGARIAARDGAGGAARGISGARHRTQVARNRFVKISIALVRRHGPLHPLNGTGLLSCTERS